METTCETRSVRTLGVPSSQPTSRTRRLLPLFVALALMAAGCGDDDNASSNDVDAVSAVATETEGEPETEGEADSDPDSNTTTDDTVSSGALEGSYRILAGEGVKAAVDAAAAEVASAHPGVTFSVEKRGDPFFTDNEICAGQAALALARETDLDCPVEMFETGSSVVYYFEEDDAILALVDALG